MRFGDTVLFESKAHLCDIQPMKKFTGIVQTENPIDAGRVIFTLRLENGSLLSCRSGAGYKSAKPKMGDMVALVGDTIRDIRTGGESHEVFYSSLEILQTSDRCETTMAG